MLIVIFVLEVIVGVGGLLLKHKTDEFINKALTDTMKRYNTTNNTEITQLWDRVQNNVSNAPPQSQFFSLLQHFSSIAVALIITRIGKMRTQLRTAKFPFLAVALYQEVQEQSHAMLIRRDFTERDVWMLLVITLKVTPHRSKALA